MERLLQVRFGNPVSAQKPQVVIDAVTSCYAEEYANIHRGVYFLSQLATEKFEGARAKVQRFLNAAETRRCRSVYRSRGRKGSRVRTSAATRRCSTTPG